MTDVAISIGGQNDTMDRIKRVVRPSGGGRNNTGGIG
jgi:hypothetical protein